MGIAALILGILSIVGMVVGFFPCLGALNWLNVPLATVGLIISIIATVKETGTEQTKGIAGIAMCSIAIIVGIIRLVMGGGVL